MKYIANHYKNLENMKARLIYMCIALSIAATSCDSNEVDDTADTVEDTAILVEDPGNTLQADPINDTTVLDTTTAY
jgi:hypothetical protein